MLRIAQVLAGWVILTGAITAGVSAAGMDHNGAAFLAFCASPLTLFLCVRMLRR
jgi:hypothetical protein